MPSSACKKNALDRKSTRLNSSHTIISYAVFCLEKKSLEPLPSRHALPRGAGCVAPNLGSAALLTRLARQTMRISLRYTGLDLMPHLFFNDPAPTEIYTLSLHDALPINDTATTETYTLSLHDALPISVVAVSFTEADRELHGHAVARLSRRRTRAAR